jgi:copper chaperone
MRYEINVENIRCGGCASTISSKLKALEGVQSIDVDIANGIVRTEASEGMLASIISSLLDMGYPEVDTAEGIAAAKAKAKSFVSCAVGKFNSN